MVNKRQKHPSTLQGHRPKPPGLTLLPTATWTRADLADKTVATLREFAADRGLQKGGIKDELIDRLLRSQLSPTPPPLPPVDWPAGTDWHPYTPKVWRDIWSSGVTALWDREAMVGPMTRYVFTIDRWLKLNQLVTGREVVLGSRRQARANPLFGTMAALAVELRQVEEKFGLTPLDAMRLGIDAGGAARGLKDAADILDSQTMQPDEYAVPAGWDVEIATP